MFILTCSVPHCPFDQPIDSHRRREFTSGRIPVSVLVQIYAVLAA
jgi:hypothetical protein